METELDEIKVNLEILQAKITRLQNFKLKRYNVELQQGELGKLEILIDEDEQGEFIRVSELLKTLGL